MKYKYHLFFLIFLPLLCSCQDDENKSSRNTDKINLPEGFHIETYAADIPNARAMVLADDGTLFAGSRSEGKVYAVTSGKRDVIVLDENISSPAGVDLHDGDLYVSAVSKILKYNNVFL